METSPNETPVTAVTPDETTDTTTPIAPKEPVALRQLLARAGRVYDMTIAVALEDAELDDLPMRGVSVLRRIDAGGAPTPLSHVLREGRISRQHGTQLIDTLVDRGYIVRETDPEDRRRMRVRLTERGQAAVDAVRTAVDGLNAALDQQVTPEQLEASRAVLSALIDLAPQRDGADAGWGPGPDRGFFPQGRAHGHGHRHDRGFGRGPRGPMRDVERAMRGDWRQRMHAFAAGEDEDAPGERHPRHDREAFAEGRHERGHDRHGHSRNHGHSHHRGPGCERGHARGTATTIVQHVDTLIVRADAPSARHERRGRHHFRGHGNRPFGPWRGERTRPETPAADAPTTE